MKTSPKKEPSMNYTPKCKLSAAAAIAALSASCAWASVDYTPGTYSGEAIGRNGPIKVEATVDDKKITKIKIVSHNESKGLSDKPIADIPKQIIANQSLVVDVVAGATFTSKGLVGAVENAVSKAAKDISPLLVAPAAAVVKVPEKNSYDVIVVGSGFSGLAASISAKENGVEDVLVVEKQGMLGAGDSMNVSTGLAGGGSKLVAKLGYKNATAQDFAEFLKNTAKTKNVPINVDNVVTYALRTGETIDWLMDMGVPFGRYQANKFFHLIDDGSAPGPHVVKALSERLKKDGIDYRLNTRATELIMENGRIAGVKVKTKDSEYTLKSKVVIIASGGYSNNPEMVKKWAPQWMNRPTTGAVSLTGDGINMAEKAGVALAAMDQVKANYLCHPITDKEGVSLAAITPYAVLVNHDGKRFVDESHNSINFRSYAEMRQPKHEAYAVVDQKTMDALKLMRNYADAGYFVKANTFEELADLIDVDKKTFVETMNNYVKYCKDGKDPEFNRRIDHPLLTAPYYASLVTPSMQSTYGGIKTNVKAEAIGVDGKPVPGLYAAGSTSGHEAYANEVGSAAIIGLVYGRIAGENAAAYIKK